MKAQAAPLEHRTVGQAIDALKTGLGRRLITVVPFGALACRETSASSIGIC